MSTSDQDGHVQLTRRQLRELRMTGSTPVISEQEAADAGSQPQTPPTPAGEPDAPESADAAPQHEAAAPAFEAPAREAEDAAPEVEDAAPESASGAPLTRREMRAQERARTASLPVQDPEPEAAEGQTELAPATEAAPDAVGELIAAPPAAGEILPAEPHPAGVVEGPLDEDVDEDDEPVGESPAAPRPAFQSLFDVPLTEPAASAEQDPSAQIPDAASAAAPAASALFPPTEPAHPADEEERPVVGAAFGLGVKTQAREQRMPGAFDDLLGGDATGSHRAPSTLIFTPSPGVGSLSGPIAATGELLITGTYTLPDGLGSQGHAHGTADGKDVDAALIDGELAPASSPTPIAASSAVSTSKPAGEVIRPPAPDKGNRLMLTLAIVAGGLALALATALIIAFTTGVFG